MLTKGLVGILGAVALAGAYLIHEGALQVSVEEQVAGGKQVQLVPPAGLVPPGMKFVPDQKLWEATAEAARGFPPSKSPAKNWPACRTPS